MTVAHMFWFRDEWIGMGPFEVIWGSLMALFWLAFWVLVVVLIVRLVKRGGVTHSGSSLQVLEERYARGEISRDEFLERRDVLAGKTPPSVS